MNAIQEKKIFSIQLKPTSLDISKRWYFDAYIITHNGKDKKRVRLYGNINKGTTVDERLKLADQFIKTLNAEVPQMERESILKKALVVSSVHFRFKTVSAYQTVLTYWLKFLKGKPDKNATAETVNDFIYWLYKNGTNQNTIAKYRNTLFTLYNKAFKLGYCTFNPVEKVPGIRRNPVSLQYFTDKQILNLKNEIRQENPQLWLCVQLLFYCFIRPGEIRFLKISDINLDYSFIEIRAEFSKNKKTQKVAIPDKFAKELEFIRNFPNNYYLVSKSGRPGADQLSIKWIYNAHLAFLQRLKITGRYSFYSWKHTGVVKCVQAGLNIRDIQNQLRHHSLDMVQIYLQNLGVLQSEDLKKKYPTL